MDETSVADARWQIEISRRLIQAARAAIADGSVHIVKSEETIAEAQRILALTKVR
jgi:hypothetical protein